MIYGSLTGLVFAAMYYVFKPSEGLELPDFQVLKRRLLVFCCWGSTVSAIVGAMVLASEVFRFNSVITDDLGNNKYGNYANAGIAFVVISATLGLYLSW